MNRGATQRNEAPTRWYHVPVVWVGIVSIGGAILICVVTVVHAMQQDGGGLERVAPGGTFGLPPLEERAADDRSR